MFNFETGEESRRHCRCDNGQEKAKELFIFFTTFYSNKPPSSLPPPPSPHCYPPFPSMGNVQ